jgi:hypothetical protein
MKLESSVDPLRAKRAIMQRELHTTKRDLQLWRIKCPAL